MPVWMKEKLFLSKLISEELNNAAGVEKENKFSWRKKLLFPEHHQSHAASAFFPSPFKTAAILTIDGVGEWATTSAGVGRDNELQIIYEIHFPHSLGLLYSAFTYYTGFKVNSGEYKVMGLAPYGEPKYTQLIYDNLIDLKEDGSFSMNMDYFNYCTGLTMTNGKFDKIFGGPPRKPETNLTQREMDLARSVQDVTEEVVRRMVKFLKKETGEENLCLAGGVALNCVANGKILKEEIFKNVWIQPCAGDAGGALGAALAVWYQYLGNKRNHLQKRDSMEGAYLGPSYSDSYIENFLCRNNIPFKKLNESDLIDKVADLLAEGKIIGWLNGRMEFGPRALGARSIIGDARSTKMQSIMNLKIKYRESFRPFAPSVLREKISEYFELDYDSPYMLLVAPVRKERCVDISKEKKNLWGIDLLNVPRSDIPAVTHIDYSARIQTVHEDSNPKYYKLIKKFEEKTGCAVIVNTSFNVRGEPIVCSPEDAYRCFMRTEMDYLVLEDFLLDKKEQKPLENDTNWRKEFELD
ncbi:MAG: carbamoyltransferase [Candidatus Schekmanbacteria bacterium GWA2_38_11]|uniref:Carbamoyltransferase n=1 Tax=Candidatus Schekmanbacteria bacterium GWA2_38_11 TaxID=1817876 RepID=A0A1F7REK0_9BACT|nr:MAG: carbamoyltransferase [Candidatus Schekmanbacteria bacterium GWA2_38_11]